MHTWWTSPGHWTKLALQDYRLPHGLTSWWEAALLVESECQSPRYLRERNSRTLDFISIPCRPYPAPDWSRSLIIASRFIFNDGILVLLKSIGGSLCHSFPVWKILLLHRRCFTSSGWAWCQFNVHIFSFLTVCITFIAKLTCIYFRFSAVCMTLIAFFCLCFCT